MRTRHVSSPPTTPTCRVPLILKNGRNLDPKRHCLYVRPVFLITPISPVLTGYTWRSREWLRHFCVSAKLKLVHLPRCRMATFVFRCPNTGLNVQGWSAE